MTHAIEDTGPQAGPHAGPSSAEDAPSIGALLAQLRSMMQAQAEAINTDDFVLLERLTTEREPLVGQLSHYAVADLNAEDRVLAEQVAALDQQLMELTRESITRTGREIRDLDRGRTALQQYGQRGRQLIQNLSYLNRQG
jgi:ABC-type phosphate transport system auxiliary subunit